MWKIDNCIKKKKQKIPKATKSNSKFAGQKRWHLKINGPTENSRGSAMFGCEEREKEQKNLFFQYLSPRKGNKREEHAKGTRLSNNGSHKSYTSLLRTT